MEVLSSGGRIGILFCWMQCRVVLFGYTAFSKLWDIKNFQSAMWHSKSIRPYIIPLSYIVPIIEIIISLLLAIHFIKITASKHFQKVKINFLKIGLYASFILMLAFTGYVVYILIAFDGNLPCTCGGFISTMTWPQHLILNGLFLLLAVRGIYLMRKQKKLENI